MTKEPLTIMLLIKVLDFKHKKKIKEINLAKLIQMYKEENQS